MNNITTTLISVIVPVYNTEKRLKRCVESILKQSYKNFELLLINDGSKDSSGKICDEFNIKDNRVKVFHKSNGGASSARNHGIKYAKGEYICFIDSDDYVDEDYLSSFIVDALNKDRNTLVVQDLQFVYGDKYRKYANYVEGLYNKDNFSSLFTLNEIDRRGGPVCKLYNKDLIINNNLEFNPAIHAGEDLLFYISYLSLIKNVYLLSATNYHAVSSVGSLSKRYNGFESEYMTYNLLKGAYQNLFDNHIIDSSAISKIQKNSLSYHLLRSIFSIYRSDYKEPLRVRLNILKQLYIEENLSLLRLRYQEMTKFYRLSYYLYKNKQFYLFDLFNLLTASLWKKIR